MDITTFTGASLRLLDPHKIHVFQKSMGESNILAMSATVTADVILECPIDAICCVSFSLTKVLKISSGTSSHTVANKALGYTFLLNNPLKSTLLKRILFFR